MSKLPNIEAIDVFCGAGGLSYGLQQAGIKVLAGIDVDKACQYPFEKNIKATFLKRDVRKITSAELNALYSPGATKMLAGCAPCQPFSSFRNTKDSNEEDEKWTLLDEFSRLVDEVQPDLVTMENVPPLRSKDVFKQFVAKLKSQKYEVDVQVVYCPAYGIPQQRRRLVLIASRLGPIAPLKPLYEPADYPSVRKTIEKLPEVESGKVYVPDPLHRAVGLNDLNLKRIRQSKPGGTWMDWPVEIRSECHTKKSGASFQSVYARMEWDKPSPTITTQSHNYGTGRFGHPEQDRAITLREAAMIQSFPDHYQFAEPAQITFAGTGRLIGNAVPPKLGTAIGEHFKKHLVKKPPTKNSLVK
ncbi:DNA cytosine methyltransferase [Hymenobacter convexus]|uniref:DNA cytosine methyltransferase n=1 Tax=Hymenobacter sp. CA1UV-4 TaxID=3063782 RepID=UPI002713823B|nr:DNA cytosine methyltransferase [Hymenobacter sp. CA1UV-4]MDO7853192.1 DNA cytosine methyltransferase [Hymenobacter sp. CA1UV-4]